MIQLSVQLNPFQQLFVHLAMVVQNMYINKQSSFFLLFLSLAVLSRAATCGNGVRESGEQCDDGNLNIDDGCDRSCNIQPFYQCDSTVPNVCKINVVVSLTSLGAQRQTSSNTAIFLFKLNYKLSVLDKIDFQNIFDTSIGTVPTSVDYSSATNLMKVTLDYRYDIENTEQSFQILLAKTQYFWYNSTSINFELHGSNCELTYQQNLWLHKIFTYVFLTIIIITLLVGFSSILFEKWIGLQLIQTYQGVYYMMLLLKEYPYEFTPIIQMLRYSNGFDHVVPDSFQRTYTLSTHLNGLGIQKEFLANLNVSLGLLIASIIVLVVLAIFKFRRQVQLQCQVSSTIKRKLQRLSKYFDFAFGQVFIMLVLTFMFKIVNSFLVQLNKQTSSQEVFTDEFNSTMAVLAFLILFGVIIFILNWCCIIPDTLTENDVFHFLRFRNMKFIYPLIYLAYQIVFICTLSIYYRRQFLPYVLIVLQVAYLMLILFVWPYNTPRKINRILHNSTILFNQSILILISIMNFRWESVQPGAAQAQSNVQFTAYLFLIVLFLVCSTTLTLVRLFTFNKDIQICVKQEEDDNNDERVALNPTTSQIPAKLIRESSIIANESAVKAIKPSCSGAKEDEQASTSKTKTVSHFLNDQYSNWMKSNVEEMKKSKSSVRARNIRKTSTKMAQLIKNPIDILLQMRKKETQRLQL